MQLSTSPFTNYQIWKHGEDTHALSGSNGRKFKNRDSGLCANNKLDAPSLSPHGVNAPL